MHQVAGYKVIEQTSISESQWFDNFILTIVVRLKPSIISNIRILSFCLKIGFKPSEQLQKDSNNRPIATMRSFTRFSNHLEVIAPLKKWHLNLLVVVLPTLVDHDYID